MSDWTMRPRNDMESRLHIAGYRITYNSACMYTVYPPAGIPAGRPGGWLYYGRSLEEAWTAAYQHNQKRGDVPLALLEICKSLIDLHERDEYPSVQFANRLIDLREWLKDNHYA